MKFDFGWPNDFDADVRFGLIDGDGSAPQRYNPALVVNGSEGTMLQAIREQLRKSDYFDFSVAFVTTSAIATLKQSFIDFSGSGRITTSNYLQFNSPEAFAELLNLRQHGIDVRLHPSKGFHPKGYVFRQGETWTVFVGSSNLTQTALTSNVEWNLKVSARESSDLARQVRSLSRLQESQSVELSQSWIDAYGASFESQNKAWHQSDSWTPTESTTVPVQEIVDPRIEDLISPNSMQREALAEIKAVRLEGADKAIIVSATGTGKTILSALDVRDFSPERMLFVVHREQILDRTIEEYRKVLGGPPSDYGKLAGVSKQTDRRYLFATIQSLSRPDVLFSLAPDHFDYIVYDEAHRAGAQSHQFVIDHFHPKFALGMTATPERTDGFNVFELFDYNVPYEIRLNDALEADMLSPFHYYGVADIGDESAGDLPSIAFLASDERVSYILDKLDIYAQAGVEPKGLIYCSRNEEARRLSEEFNQREFRGRRLRTIALSGADNVAYRNSVVRKLEAGELDYIFTVDIFNEGIDIPAVNQVIMLRQTKSVIVFVQQLGRGLRKSAGKEHLVVLDFIGNYANNFMIPIALFGDESLNKESLRKNLIVAEETGVVAGMSSIQFDRIAQDRVLKAISDASLDSLQMIRQTVVGMRDRLGKIPRLLDFYRFESADPVLLATKKNNFAQLLSATIKHASGLDVEEQNMLSLLSQEMFTSKRLHEFVVFQELIGSEGVSIQQLVEVCEEAGLLADVETIESAVDSFTLEFHAQADRNKHSTAVVDVLGSFVSLSDRFRHSYSENLEFREHVDDLLATGKRMVLDRYDHTLRFTPGRQYSRKEVTRLLNWPRKWTSTLYGYRADVASGFCPIFVTLHKSEEISESTAYEDELLDIHSMRWFTRSRRTLQSGEVAAIVDQDVEPHVFVKKDDAEGTDFYYLGRAVPRNATQTTMKGASGEDLDVVTMTLHFEDPIEHSLFNYFHPDITQ